MASLSVSDINLANLLVSATGLSCMVVCLLSKPEILNIEITIPRGELQAPHKLGDTPPACASKNRQASQSTHISSQAETRNITPWEKRLPRFQSYIHTSPPFGEY
jgi:hypothetical protein